MLKENILCGYIACNMLLFLLTIFNGKACLVYVWYSTIYVSVENLECKGSMKAYGNSVYSITDNTFPVC
jgi:hypothetical protein